jgi:hypothetical protein
MSGSGITGDDLDSSIEKNNIVVCSYGLRGPSGYGLVTLFSGACSFPEDVHCLGNSWTKARRV